MQQSLIQALGIIDCCILKRSAKSRFEVLHSNLTWFPALLPEATGKSHFTFSEESAYLQDFLIDAEEFWQIGNAGQIQSGIWSEQTEQGVLRLEAIAAIANGERFLVISNLQQEYDRQQKTLQVARELLLSNDKILAQHEYVHERLDALLTEKENLQDQQAPIQQAIENANYGVIIVDSSLKPIQLNNAAYQLFDVDHEGADNDPLGIILSLFEKQFPEFDRVFATASRWNGELFWHKPPNTSKWLQLAIYPVLDEKKAVKHWLFIVSDITRLKYLLQTNEKLTLYDSVTGLPNRQFFWQNLEQKIKASKSLYVLYIDVKNFKRVNELHGHLAGDEVLVHVAKRIQPMLEPNDIFARVGGDEFVVIHQAKSPEECKELASRLISAIEIPFYTAAEHKCLLGLNIGAAHFPRDASNAEDLMKFADLAVYEAKKKSKSAIMFYSMELKEASRKRLELEAALRDAIEDNQFELLLQPMLDLESGLPIKAEALLRWHQPDGNTILPDTFIPVAEQSGLIIPIGKWVIARACEMLRVLQQQGQTLKISVNLSPRQVSDRHLFEFIESAVELSDINPASLELELTEGVLVDNYDKVQLLLEKVRELGISVSIDDFGTGYSSLSYLKKLPIDYLKIDRSFVQDLDTDENDKAIVLAVIAMAHSLKLGVIAEGVENEQQRDFLRLNHCDTAQGYLFSKPIPFDTFCTEFVPAKSTDE